MMAGIWEFEAADPEVGFLTDTVAHACEANQDAEPAEQESTLHTATRRKADGTTERVVAELTKFTCPVCHATTATVDHWPLWMFEEGE